MQQLLQRRQVAADQHDQVRGQFRNYADPAFARAMAPIAAELDRLHRAAQQEPGLPAGEVARTIMWFGDALFDLAQGGHVTFELVRETYGKAARYLVAANDPALRAKFDGNLANVILRGQPDAAGLRQAIAGYQAAIAVLGVGPATATYRAELARAAQLLQMFDEFGRELVARREEAVALLHRVPAHHLDPVRAARVSDRLRALAALATPTGLTEMARVLNEARAALQELMELASQRAASPRCPRGGALAALAMELWQLASAEAMGTTISPSLRDPLFDTLRGLVELAVSLRQAAPATCAELERVQLRPLCAEARRLLAIDRVTWARPAWPATTTTTVHDRVHVSGTALLAAIAPVCAERGLAVATDRPGAVYAEARFASLRQAAAVIVDLTGDARDRAAACYEAGVAMVLGKPVIIVAAPGRLPFDVDLEPVAAAGGLDRAGLGAALDRALVLPQRAPSPVDRAPLLAAARAEFRRSRYLVDELARGASGPVDLAAGLETIAENEATNGEPTRVVVVPAWPRRYPDPQARRVFHVMPFTAAWSGAVKAAVAAQCAEAGAAYRRHDDVDDPRILRSLWSELSAANLAVVDLTDLNPNVALELGVLDALGTPTLLVGQAGTVERLFRSIRETRVTEYALGDGRLEAAVARFVVGRG